MRKIILILVILALAVIPQNKVYAAENELEKGVESLLGDIDTDGLNDYLLRFYDDTSADEMISSMSSGNFSWGDYSEIFTFLFSLLCRAAEENIPNFIMIFIVIIIISLMRHFTASFSSAEVSKAGLYAGNLLVCTVVTAISLDIIYTASEAVAELSEFISYLSPILLPLLIALGGYSSNAVLTPAVAAFNSFVVSFFNYFIIPLIIVCLVFAVISNYSKNNVFNGFSDLLSSIIKWLMGIVFIVFLGIVMIQGIGAANFDGISIRTAKYTIDKTIPVVGGMFSDSMDTMIVCSSVVKNAIGMTGLVIICGIILFPAVKLLINILIFKAVGIFTSPFASNDHKNMFTSVSGVITLALVAVLITGAMAFMLVSLMIGVGNINIMTR